MTTFLALGCLRKAEASSLWPRGGDAIIGYIVAYVIERVLRFRVFRSGRFSTRAYLNTCQTLAFIQTTTSTSISFLKIPSSSPTLKYVLSRPLNIITPSDHLTRSPNSFAHPGHCSSILLKDGRSPWMLQLWWKCVVFRVVVLVFLFFSFVSLEANFSFSWPLVAIPVSISSSTPFPPSHFCRERVGCLIGFFSCVDDLHGVFV